MTASAWKRRKSIALMNRTCVRLMVVAKADDAARDCGHADNTNLTTMMLMMV